MKKDYKTDVKRKAVKKKVDEVNSTIADIKNYPTVALIDLRKLPDSLLQKIRKRIRDEGGKVLILKKPVIERVLASNKKLAARVSECNKPVGLILTKSSPYQLHTFFKQNKKRRAAKIGDVAPFDIVVPEGETDLPPGPALSELKTAGINAQIKAGKIVIAKASVVAKNGETISDLKAKALQKVGVMPFEMSVRYIFGYDGEYIYPSELFLIDETINADLAACMFNAFNLSVNASYPTSGNIDVLLGEALRQSMNVAINGSIYSSSAIEQLLTSAVRQGMALEGLEKTKL